MGEVNINVIRELLAVQQSAYKDATSIIFDGLSRKIDFQTKQIYDVQTALEYSQKDIQENKAELDKYKILI